MASSCRIYIPYREAEKILKLQTSGGVCLYPEITMKLLVQGVARTISLLENIVYVWRG